MSRKSQRWTAEEEENLIEGKKNGLTFAELEEKLGRTKVAISLRLKGIVKRWIELDSLPVEEIVKRLGISKEEVEFIKNDITIKANKICPSIKKKNKKVEVEDEINLLRSEITNLVSQQLHLETFVKQQFKKLFDMLSQRE